MERLRIESIRLDGGTQPRGKLSQQQIRSYTEDMRAGAAFPPVDVVYDGQVYWLWDGFHRVHACRLAGASEIDAHVTAGTQADAQWLSYSANRAHGLNRSNEDKGRAVKAALTHPNGADRSDREIAQHVGVHYETVAKYRAELEKAGTIGRSDSRTGRDGRKINTARIGKKGAAGKRGPRRSAAKPFTPIRGHSDPPPMMPLSLPVRNPELAAGALIDLFDTDWLTRLVARISTHLRSLDPTEGEPA